MFAGWADWAARDRVYSQEYGDRRGFIDHRQKLNAKKCHVYNAEEDYGNVMEALLEPLRRLQGRPGSVDREVRGPKHSEAIVAHGAQTARESKKAVRKHCHAVT
mmetsp:Transcript_767/g.557  ORF Transcript_767/g.557 Transcript_767/m.557 type:complete len:104 (-) Transcript_767:12-323(-)